MRRFQATVAGITMMWNANAVENPQDEEEARSFEKRRSWMLSA
jgi:hypothetical protein